MEVDKHSEYKDAWQNDFEVSFDLNYTGSIDNNKIVGDNTDLNTNVAIYSLGPDGSHNKLSDTDTVNEDNIKSWDNN